MQTRRLEVMPPWLCPASQKLLTRSLPSAAMTVSVIACRWASSSAPTQTRTPGPPGVRLGEVAAVGVITTSRYLFT